MTGRPAARGASGSSSPVAWSCGRLRSRRSATATCSCARRSRASAPERRCSPTGASSMPTFRSTRRSAPSAARSAIRSATATAAWASSRRAEVTSRSAPGSSRSNRTRSCSSPAQSDVVPLGAVDDRAATLFPLVETALQICLDAGAVFGERVVVYGLGTVGALTSLLVQRAGADVVAVEPRRWRRELMSRLGLRCVAPEDLDDVLSESGASRPGCRSSSRRPVTRRRCARRCRASVTRARRSSRRGTAPRRSCCPLGAEFHRRRLSLRSTQVSTIPARLSDRWTPADGGPRRSSCWTRCRWPTWRPTRSPSTTPPAPSPRSMPARKD